MAFLRYETSQQWTDHIIAHFDAFLIDHAAAEKKASGMAISMISHYPDRKALVDCMADLAVEEMSHYREVIKLIHDRGLQLGPDAKDHYVIAFRKAIRNGREEYFLDRLIIASIIEARGAERFGLIADALPEGQLKSFYKAITKSEHRHYEIFIELAYQYFDKAIVDERVSELLDIEADICRALPITSALH
jgi:tRNA-(ms[2]io[6]A)-hydroxylase